MPVTSAPPGKKRPVEDRPDSVYHELRELIVSGRLAPGTRLIETTVARRFGVSRTPIRSAFHRLLREGYAVSVNEDDERQRLAVAPMTAAPMRTRRRVRPAMRFAIATNDVPTTHPSRIPRCDRLAGAALSKRLDR